ncbi:MAG: phage major capsid protein [Clostridia bacterium]|nr:phage major capsid protein [Clostridia bacterium]
MVTLYSADNVLKTFYLDAMAESLNMKTNPFLAQIERTASDVVGKDVRKIMRVGMNMGIGAGNEAGDLPKAKNNNYQALVAPLKNLYGTIEISDKALRASASNEGAFVNLLNEEMNALVKSASFNFGRMLFGDGSGTIAIVTVTASEGFVGVDNVQNFVTGMYVQISSDGTNFWRVGKIDRETNSVQLFKNDSMEPISAGVAAQGEVFFINEGSLDNEITGLGAIFQETGTIYGLDKEKNGLQPYIMTDVGEIQDNVIQKAIDEVEATSGNAINFIICSWGVRRALINYYKEHNMSLPTIEIEGGFKALSFNGIPIVVDRFCPASTMYLLNTNAFKLHQLCDWQWLESEDGKILKQVPGKPVYTATLVKYAELLCEQPQGQAMLTGIVEL